MTRSILLVVLVAAWSAGCTPSLGDVKPALSETDSGTIWLSSAGSLVRTPDGSRLSLGLPLVLSAELRFPSGAPPFPAVVLAHGCRGAGNTEAGWAAALREWGYATLVVDSFATRGLREVCTSARTLTSAQRVPDVYGALRILATHPRIDASRIALMGFSHGGGATLAAATRWARETFAPGGQAAFRAFLAFYPSCNIAYPEAARISAPLRLHTGELDDWTPVAPCIRLVELLRASGQDATITVYPGAHHSFDNIGRPITRLANVDSAAGCALRLPSILGPFPVAAGGMACMRKGATFGWNPVATEQARRAVRTQLVDVLK